MGEERIVILLDRYEHGVVINALNDLRTDLIRDKRETDIIDEVLIKVIDAPKTKKVSINKRRKQYCNDTR